MTRLDFELLAECLKAVRHQIDSDAWEVIVYAVADTYHLAYMGFDRDEFLRKCGAEPFGPQPPSVKP